MVIFHSYVSLPEGNGIVIPYDRDNPWDIIIYDNDIYPNISYPILFAIPHDIIMW